MLYQASGNPDAAAKVVADMLRVTPTPESYALAARLYTMFGDRQQADAVRAEARRAFADTPRAARARGAMMHLNGAAERTVATNLNAELAKHAEKSSVFLCVLCGLCVLACAVAWPGADAQSPPNVLLITLDTVRADRIGAYGYAKASTPVLDRLAREGVRFADATTQAPLTAPAHAALLTGLYPARIGVRDNATTPVPETVTTAAELFKGKGYRTGGFVGAFILAAPYGFAQGFDTFDADFPGFSDSQKLQVQRRGDAVVDAALAWLGAGARSRSSPGCISTTRTRRTSAPAPFDARFRASPYDGEIAYVDACIGRLMAALERTGRLDSHHRRRGRRPRRKPRRARRAGARHVPLRRRAAHPVDPAAAGPRACRADRHRAGSRHRRPADAGGARRRRGCRAPTARASPRHRTASRAASRRPPTPKPSTRNGTTAGAS